MLQAVVEVEFTRLETLPDLAVQPEFIAIRVQTTRLAIGIEGQQIRPQPFRQRSCWTFGERPLRQALLLGEHALGPGQRREPRAVRGDAGKVERDI